MKNAHTRIESRIDRIKQWFELNPSSDKPLQLPDAYRKQHPLSRAVMSPENEYIIEPVSTGDIRYPEHCPTDMLMLLEKIGSMRRWGYCGTHVLNWCAPCDISTAISQKRCPYLEDGGGDSIINAKDLLFFGYDCSPDVFFYDVSSVPWTIVSIDGLSLWPEPELNKYKPEYNPYFKDAVSIIEMWISYYDETFPR